ncbi:MAG TPA: DUF1599 domain-containing protein [Prolixibacteraceae bacterium]|jgi:hypothetical protein|nr:DUF1599 domain-containing protein [Prolixibacteraceae bacterium]HPJ77726.1 DUF1599 domain-containing protein [Prolixibacteraceae bacterium]HRV89139.1 DUF1599 domain-containing protein [Prolixibacteraceae bacterium]
MEKTSDQYDLAAEACREVFVKKMGDYGTAWQILRPASITDQIFIKARRIRNIEEKGVQMIGDDVRSEYTGIINYAIMGIIQLNATAGSSELSPGEALLQYNTIFTTAKNLMAAKNHDYGEAWREMRTSSYTDLILMKIRRIKQIEDNQGLTTVSEGIDANYLDIINYSVFALIKTAPESK